MSALGTAQQFVDISRRVESLSDFRALMDCMALDLGFDHFTMVHKWDGHLPAQDRHMLQSDDMIAICTYPYDWIEEYMAIEAVRNDPVIHARRVAPKAFEWSEIPAMIAYEPQHAEIDMRARKAGIVDGYTIPAVVPGESEGSVNFAISRTGALPAKNFPTAQLIAALAFQKTHDLMRRRNRAQLPAAVRLSTRQLECIELAAKGKTDWEIAQILAISPETVKKYMETARRKYGVRKRIQLVLRTIYDGQLTIRDVIT